MDEQHVFSSSGEACPICIGLDGAPVPAGYKPHEGCRCSTMPENEEECEVHAEHVGNDRYGSGSLDVVAGIEVTVICPDGTEIGESVQIDMGQYGEDFDAAVAAYGEAVQAAAAELCAQCPPPPPIA